MLSQAQNAELYAEWLAHIYAQEAQEAFCYFVGRAAVLRSVKCHPQHKGVVRDVRFIDNRNEQPFSFIPNKTWLLFYFRAPAVRSGKYSFQQLSAAFDSAAENNSLAPAAKAERMASARALLAMPQANPAATEAVRDFMQRVARMDIERCPHCNDARWRVVGCQEPLRLGQAAQGSPHAAAPHQACRGPP